MAGARYWELALPLPAETAEVLTNFVWELGALGVVEEAAADGSARLRAFFADPLAADLRTRLEGYLASLRALGLPGAGPATLGALEDPGWVEAWREHFRPLPVGRRLLVAPPWAVPPAAGRVVLVIEPGRAFGTGHHATTAGCLAALEGAVERAGPARALDLGTGSGILAIAAARLGVAAVLAIDSDPDAVALARDNAARNGVADRVTVRLGDAADLEAAPAPLVVANLLGAAHRALAARYADLVAPGGTLVLGGVLEAEAAEVSAAVAGPGFRPLADEARAGWSTLALRREVAPAPLHHRA